MITIERLHSRGLRIIVEFKCNHLRMLITVLRRELLVSQVVSDLSNLDDRKLRDIGIDRFEIRHVARRCTELLYRD